jgi:hypothetical protein
VSINHHLNFNQRAPDENYPCKNAQLLYLLFEPGKRFRGRHLVKDFGYLQQEATPHDEDSKTLIDIEENDTVEPQTKHIKIPLLP